MDVVTGAEAGCDEGTEMGTEGVGGTLMMIVCGGWAAAAAGMCGGNWEVGRIDVLRPNRWGGGVTEEVWFVLFDSGEETDAEGGRGGAGQ